MSYSHAGTLENTAYGRPRSALEAIHAYQDAENLPPSQRLEPMPFDYSRTTARRVWLFDPAPRMGRPPLILRWSWRWEGGTPA